MSENFPADAETMRALHDAMAAMLLSIVSTMPAAQRTAVATNLARLAANAEKKGNQRLEAALLDLYRMAQM